eukprot:4191013-Pyramimonas_sp.AAC.1
MIAEAAEQLPGGAVWLETAVKVIKPSFSRSITGKFNPPFKLSPPKISRNVSMRGHGALFQPLHRRKMQVSPSTSRYYPSSLFIGSSREYTRASCI